MTTFKSAMLFVLLHFGGVVVASMERDRSRMVFTSQLQSNKAASFQQTQWQSTTSNASLCGYNGTIGVVGDWSSVAFGEQHALNTSLSEDRQFFE